MTLRTNCEPALPVVMRRALAAADAKAEAAVGGFTVQRMSSGIAPAGSWSSCEDKVPEKLQSKEDEAKC